MSNKKEAYLCLSAMLRAREPRLLSNERAERMLDAPNFEEAAKLFTDCGYADMSQMSANEIEAELAAHRQQVFAELEQFSPDKELVDVFRMKYDYHNIKSIIKAEAMGLDPKRLLSASGRIDPERLLNLYNEDKLSELPGTFAAAIEEAKSVLVRSSNPQLADFVLDKAYFAELRSAADKIDCSFLKGYAEILIDSANLKSAVRTIRMGKGAGFLESVIIPGGGVSAESIINAGDKDGIAALFAHSGLEKAAALGSETAEGGTMTAFELACDNAVNSYLRSAKLSGYGPEPVLAYIATVEGEITAARMILTGRLSGIKPQVIRERLRDLYA